MNKLSPYTIEKIDNTFIVSLNNKVEGNTLSLDNALQIVWVVSGRDNSLWFSAKSLDNNIYSVYVSERD